MKILGHVRRYKNKPRWVGHILRCSCGCRFKLETKDQDRVKEDYFYGATEHTYRLIPCPKCKQSVVFE